MSTPLSPQYERNNLSASFTLLLRISLKVDTVVICAGQECFATLFEPVKKKGQRVFLIGGAQAAGELDGENATLSIISIINPAVLSRSLTCVISY